MFENLQIWRNKGGNGASLGSFGGTGLPKKPTFNLDVQEIFYT